MTFDPYGRTIKSIEFDHDEDMVIITYKDGWIDYLQTNVFFANAITMYSEVVRTGK